MINLKNLLLSGKGKEMYLIEKVLNKIEKNKPIGEVSKDYTDYKDFVNQKGYNRHSALNVYLKKEYKSYLDKNTK